MSSAFKGLLTPTDRMLRQFAALWIVFFAALAAQEQFHHHRHLLAVGLGVLAATFGPLGLAWPRVIKPIFIGWMALAYPIGWLLSRVILGILFYGLFTPVAWVFRMKGRDALGLKRVAQGATYWRPKPNPADKSQYLSQF